MKKYKRISGEYVDKDHIFYEKVQRPENYLNIIKDKFIQANKKEYKDLNSLLIYLTKIFDNDKIIFKEYTKQLKYSSGIVSAGYNPNTNEIYLFYTNHIERAFKIKDIEYDSEYFNLFMENLHDFLGHEIIHRMQYLNDKKKIIGVMSTKNKIKYLEKPKEVMAHAWEIGQEFKLYGKTNEQIKMILKANRNEEENMKWLLFSSRLKTYYENFDSNSKTIKLLYKYIYLYIED